MENEKHLSTLTKAYQDFRACSLAVPDSLFLASMDGWSPRDVIAHLIGWNDGMIEAIQSILRGETPEYYSDAGSDYRSINAAYFRRYPSLSRAELLDDLDASMLAFQQFILALDPAELDASHGVRHYSGRPATAAGVILSLAGDYTAHCEQMRAWLDNQKTAADQP
jgi:hypothetical protein